MSQISRTASPTESLSPSDDFGQMCKVHCGWNGFTLIVNPLYTSNSGNLSMFLTGQCFSSLSRSAVVRFSTWVWRCLNEMLEDLSPSAFHILYCLGLCISRLGQICWSKARRTRFVACEFQQVPSYFSMVFCHRTRTMTQGKPRPGELMRLVLLLRM